MRIPPLIAVALLLASGAGAQEASESECRYQELIASGDGAALEGLRLELQKNIAVGGADAEQVAAWRYDWAYLNWRIAQQLPRSEKKARKSLLKEAEQQLDLILESRPESAEAHSLRGTVIGDRIDGGFSGAFLGKRSGDAHKRALELAADNPRVALQHGVSLYYTPKSFGGGNQQAIDELRRAVELFESGPAETEWPNWGRVDALVWLGIVLAEEGAQDEAQGFLEQAVEFEPDNRWARSTRDELRP